MPVDKFLTYCEQLLIILFKSSSYSFLCSEDQPLLAKEDDPPMIQNEFPEKCMGDLGCFKTGPPFYDAKTRPLMILPFDEKYLDTKFMLFTPTNPTEPHILTHEYDVKAENFYKPDLPTKIFTHGFGSTIEKNDSYYASKDAILQSGEYNVIIVDWSTINKGPAFQAYANARAVGAQISRLVNELIKRTGASASSFHIIGHSLGAAMAAFAAAKIKGLGRLTALDPGVAYYKDADLEIQLDVGDADFVDVIITNGAENYLEGFSTMEPIGHVNYYVNGGKTQPGCPKNETSQYDAMLHLCSHARVKMLFLESILSKDCRFIGSPCSSYENFTKGNCTLPSWWKDIQTEGSEVTQMGFFAKKSSHIPIGEKFYLNTNEKPDFCIKNSGSTISGSTQTTLSAQ